ncbi:hypothetical protein EMPG_13814 [Blastomyces silverae]|uniref:RRM domain-containing protein n=1 Tax=Blastomyces silverae TaxID=2060906 RepID=A0A0H1BIA4_9EURO|nr:hypothetical protein EMPG_13814 [Blastomyces silverae]
MNFGPGFLGLDIFTWGHAAFRAVSAFPTGFAVKPGTLAALGPSLLRLTAQPPKVAFQQRWNFNSSYQSEGYNRRNDRQEYRDTLKKEPLPPLKPNDTIYVGNLFFEVTAEDLKRDMAKFGNIHSVRIVYDSRGLSRGLNSRDQPGHRRGPRRSEPFDPEEAAETEENTFESASESVSESASEPATESASESTSESAAEYTR